MSKPDTSGARSTAPVCYNLLNDAHAPDFALVCRTAPTPHTASVYDYVPARTVEYSPTMRVREESNAPDRGSYLIVEVESESAPRLSSIDPTVRGAGLRCRIVESRDWPAGAGGLLRRRATPHQRRELRPGLPPRIAPDAAVRVVTRPVDRSRAPVGA